MPPQAAFVTAQFVAVIVLRSPRDLGLNDPPAVVDGPDVLRQAAIRMRNLPYSAATCPPRVRDQPCELVQRTARPPRIQTVKIPPQDARCRHCSESKRVVAVRRKRKHAHAKNISAYQCPILARIADNEFQRFYVGKYFRADRYRSTGTSHGVCQQYYVQVVHVNGSSPASRFHTCLAYRSEIQRFRQRPRNTGTTGARVDQRRLNAKRRRFANAARLCRSGSESDLPYQAGVPVKLA